MDPKPVKKAPPPPPKVKIPDKAPGSEGGFWPLLAGVVCALVLIIFIMQNLTPVPLNFFGLTLGEVKHLGKDVTILSQNPSPIDAEQSEAASAARRYLVSGGMPVWLLVLISVAFGFVGGRLIRFKRKVPRGGRVKVR